MASDRSSTALVVAAGALLVAAAAGSVWSSGRPGQALPVEPARFHRLTDSGHDRAPSASREGRALVFASERDGRRRIWVKPLAGGIERALTSGPDERPRLSSDGSMLLFIRDEGESSALYRARISGEGLQRIAVDATDADFSPDGRRIVFVRPDSRAATATVMAVAAVDGGDPREIFRLPSADGSLDSPRWSPDGTILAARHAAASTGVADSIVLLRPDGTGIRSITPPGLPGRISSLAFTESGRQLVYAESESLTSTRAQVSSRMVRLDLGSLRADELFWVPEGVEVVTFPRAGQMVFDARSTLENLREAALGVADPSATGRHLTRGRSNDRQPVYSPDGRWVVFSSDRSGNLDLWKVSVETGALEQLTNDSADDWDPAYTHDGTRLIWSSNRSGAFEIWMAGADGSGARQVTHDGVDAENPTITADGAWIVYGSANPASPGIWKVRPDGTGAVRLVAGATVWPEVSPDGAYVVYRNAPYDWPNPTRGDVSMRVARIDDGTIVPFQIKLRNGLSAGRARWMPDGRRIAFIGSDESGVNGVFVQDFAPGRDTSATRRRVAGFASRSRTESFSIAPDARRVSLAESETLSSLMIADRIAGLSE